MLNIRSSAAAIALSLLFLTPVANAETGRFTMTPTKDGVLKLDTKTGSVSLCRRANQRWSCSPVDDNSSELSKRIEQLEKENRRLRRRLATTPRVPPTTLPREPAPGGGLELPSEEEVDKAMDFMEKLIDRFKGMIEKKRGDEDLDEKGVPL